jgi:hypothetical protein
LFGAILGRAAPGAAARARVGSVSAVEEPYSGSELALTP